MEKSLVIKNTENNKYFTGRYESGWSLDITDAHTYKDEVAVEKELKLQTDPDNDLDFFDGVDCIIVETIYIK
jgi:hypothetical protein